MSTRTFPYPETLDFALILDGLADPGNLGTLLRSAAAAGCGSVLLAPGCVDAFAPKVLRSGMGAHFHQPIRSLDWPGITAFVKQYHLLPLLAAAGQGNTYSQQDLTKPVALVLGSEAHGAGAHVDALIPTFINIPMPGGSESLNVAVAGSILLFEVVRQRAAST